LDDHRAHENYESEEAAPGFRILSSSRKLLALAGTSIQGGVRSRLLQAEPSQVAKEVWAAIESGKTEVYPSMNGKVLKQMEAWLPRALLNAGLKGIARKLLQ
jgi:short-subunit dehydrogenase